MIELFDQLYDGRFPGTTFPDKGHVFSFLDIEREVFDYNCLGCWVLENHVSKLDIPRNILFGSFVLIDQGLVLKHFEDLLDCISSSDDVCVTIGDG